MAKTPPVPITVCCMMKLEATKLSFEPTELIVKLREKLQKRLLKKGYEMQHVAQSAEPTLLVQMVRLDEGSQLMRYLLPFISPAVMEVRGHVNGLGSEARAFSYVQKAQMGLFGGSPKSMMEINADRVAAKIVKDVLKAFKPAK